VIAFVTYHWLLKRIEALFLSLTTFVNTVVAVLLGAVVLGEQLSVRILVGASCVFLGILVANGQALLARVRRDA
jgi:drug/metabolite transporter (DMT)-like permease